jgi:hypothetical protein
MPIEDKNVSDKNVSILQSEIKPILLENITSETPAEVEKINTEKSENMKTIVIANQ